MGAEIVLNKDPDVVIEQETAVQVVTAESEPTVVIEQVRETDVVESHYVSEIISSCQIIAISGGGGSGGSVFVIDVTNSGSGIVGEKVYVADTIPADVVVAEALTDDDTVTIRFMAEGGSSYSPTVTIDSIECTNLQQYAGDQRLFYGSVDITVTETRTVLITSSAGSTTSVLIHRAAAPPEILSCLIGDYPTGQTAVKAGDTVHITGTVEESATHVQIVGVNAFNTSGWFAVSGGTFDVIGTVSSLSGAQSTFVKAKNSMGSEGGHFESNNTIILDQIYPTFVGGTTTFPPNQAAFKGTELGQQAVTVNNFDTVAYSSPHGDFTITDPTVYAATKDIACTHPGDYNDSSINYRIVANKIANGSSATYNKIIEVADIAPVVTITQPVTRLRSTAAGANYLIIANSNQNLSSAPAVSIPVSGVWVGGFSGSHNYFSCNITISDGDASGSAPWAWDTVPTNNSGLPASISGNEVVGGFISRSVPLAAFAVEAELGAMVTDTSKLSLVWSFKAGMEFEPIDTPAPVVNGWTVDATGVSPTTVIILDESAAGASSQESTLTIEESV